jgi:hypothetical protein
MHVLRANVPPFHAGEYRVQEKEVVRVLRDEVPRDGVANASGKLADIGH